MTNMETFVSKALDKAAGGKVFPLPEIDPWAPKLWAPELTAIRPRRVVALPPLPEMTPDGNERDIIHVSSSDPRSYYDQGLTLGGIMMAVSEVTRIGVGDIRSERRSIPMVRARQIYFWIARTYTGKSFPMIAMYCGGRDHSTVIHGVKKVSRLMNLYSGDIDRILAILKVKRPVDNVDSV